MVKARDIAILAVLGIVGFSLFKKSDGVDFGSVPATPVNFQREANLQRTFDEIGDVLEQQDTALIEAQRLLQEQIKQNRQQQQNFGPNFSGLNFSVIPSGALLTGSGPQKSSNIIGGHRPRRGSITGFIAGR